MPPPEITVAWRVLQARDAGLKGEREPQIAVFSEILDRLLTAKPRVYAVGHALIRNVTLVAWRPGNPYFYRMTNDRVSSNGIYHVGMHWMLDRRFGPRLTGRTGFILLCEAMASLTEYYFCLELHRMFGAIPAVTRYGSKVLATAAEVHGARAGRHVLALMRSRSERASFTRYREAVLEMHSFYRYVIGEAARVDRGQRLDVERLRKETRARRYGTLFHSYALGNNVLFALQKSRGEDAAGRATLRAALEVLRAARSFSELVELLVPAPDRGPRC